MPQQRLSLSKFLMQLSIRRKLNLEAPKAKRLGLGCGTRRQLRDRSRAGHHLGNRLPRRKPADRRGRIGLGRPVCKQHSDLVPRLVFGLLQQLKVILQSQVRNQQAKPRKVNLPSSHGDKNHGKFPSRTSNPNARIGHALAQMQRPSAVLKHRRITPLRIDLPRIDFRKQLQHLTLDISTATKSTLKPRDQTTAIKTSIVTRQRHHVFASTLSGVHITKVSTLFFST